MNNPFGPVGPKSVRQQSPTYDVNQLHQQDDVDANEHAHHHTLGLNRNQAAPGNVVNNGLQAAANYILVAPQSMPAGTFTRVRNWGGQLFYGERVVGGVEAGVIWQGLGVWKVDKKGWFVVDLTWQLDVGPPASYGGLEVNGTRIRSTGQPSNAFGSSGHFYYEGSFNKDDLIAFQVFHNSGVAVNLFGDAGGGDYRTFCSIRRVGIY